MSDGAELCWKACIESELCRLGSQSEMASRALVAYLLLCNAQP